MSVTHSMKLDIKQWLNNQHIIVPIEWIEACLEFLQEFHNLNMPIHQLKTCVYEQWLNADLEEIGIEVLPPNLCTVQKIVLSGTYILQVNGIRDIGKPAYSQLRQLEGTLNADSEVSATPKVSQPEWEAKPSRVLLLNLTDGVNIVQAMEYKPITVLSQNLSPGAKVLIKGPIDCRLGIILLTQDKLKVLGGEVESFLQKYSQETMLREVLQLPPNDNIQNNRTEQMDSSVSNSNFNTANNNNDNHMATFQTSLNNTNNRSSKSTRKSVMQISNQNAVGNISRFPSHQSNIANNGDDDDDFADDIDYDAVAEMERNSTQESHEQSSLPESNTNGIPDIDEDEEVFQQALLRDDDDIDPLEENYFKNPLFNMEESSVSEKSPKSSVTSLGTIMDKRNYPTKNTITIKGFISKVLSRLQCTPNKEWQLAAKISDDTGSIEADFHDKVLEELVGISAKDMMQMQHQARQNAEIKTKIMEAVANCKKKLQELNCLMEIQFRPDQRPCVIKCVNS